MCWSGTRLVGAGSVSGCGHEIPRYVHLVEAGCSPKRLDSHQRPGLRRGLTIAEGRTAPSICWFLAHSSFPPVRFPSHPNGATVERQPAATRVAAGHDCNRPRGRLASREAEGGPPPTGELRPACVIGDTRFALPGACTLRDRILWAGGCPVDKVSDGSTAGFSSARERGRVAGAIAERGVEVSQRHGRARAYLTLDSESHSSVPRRPNRGWARGAIGSQHAANL